MALKDLGYDNVQIIFSDPKNSPQLIDEKGKPKSGTAFVDGKGVRTIIINAEDPKNSTRSGLIGTLTEEGSHIIGKVEGRQIATGTDEKGLESTGRATNEYFQDKYKGDDTAISIQSDGKDCSNVDFGENVGDYSERLLYGKFDEASKSTFVNRCGSDVNTCMKLYNLTEEQREKLYSERDKTGKLVAHVESLGFGVLTAFIGGGFREGVIATVIGEIFGHYNDSTPRSNNLKEFEKQQLIIAISEIERTRATLAYLIHTNEATILGGLVNKKNIAVQDLNIANSRIEGNQRIKEMKISKILEKIYLFCTESKKMSFDDLIFLISFWLLNAIVMESNENKILGMLGITPFTSLICLILLVNQYFFRSRKPKLKELMKLVLIIVLPIIIYLLILLGILQI